MGGRRRDRPDRRPRARVPGVARRSRVRGAPAHVPPTLGDPHLTPGLFRVLPPTLRGGVRRILDRLLRRAPAPTEPYEPELTAAIERVVQPGWTCADVGAHVGNITETLVRRVGKRGRAVASQAHPTT